MENFFNILNNKLEPSDSSKPAEQTKGTAKQTKAIRTLFGDWPFEDATKTRDLLIAATIASKQKTVCLAEVVQGVFNDLELKNAEDDVKRAAVEFVNHLHGKVSVTL
jgi:hypothetical protein